LPLAAQSDTWQLDPAHSSAQFSVRHLGISTVRGAFTKLKGTLQYSPADPSKASVDVTIDAASIDTRVEKRDDDLRSDHFFDVQKFPTITFKSKRVESAGTDKLKVTGDLTMHGVTKEVTLDVEGPSKPFNDGRGHLHLGISATTTLNRTDFGVSGSPAVVGNEISVTIDAELVQPAPAPSK
jgi:polyisoprenoid-binding protein YceI